MVTIIPHLASQHVKPNCLLYALPTADYEKLMLYVILHTAQAARSNPQDADLGTLTKHMQWLLTTVECVRTNETGWSDHVSELLEYLHRASNAAGDYGPAWLNCDQELVDGEWLSCRNLCASAAGVSCCIGSPTYSAMTRVTPGKCGIQSVDCSLQVQPTPQRPAHGIPL